MTIKGSFFLFQVSHFCVVCFYIISIFFLMFLYFKEFMTLCTIGMQDNIDMLIYRDI